MAGTIDIGELSRGELNALLSSLGEPSYRVSQIYAWIHKRGALSFDEMTDIPKSLRESLKREYRVSGVDIVEVLSSPDDLVHKYALSLADGMVIEAVFMRHSYGSSLCVSTQVGCPMGCRFCASAIGGLVRSLSASEMLSEVYRIERDTGERISRIDIMGTGEPLMNYEEVVKFIRMITDEDGLNISARNIALSTSGIPDGIRRLSDEGIPLTLCLSLHAADDEKRGYLMPGAGRYSLGEVLSELRHYQDRTGRRVTYEYILIRGVNDTDDDAFDLIRLLRKTESGAHVNLIPLNPVAEREYEAPTGERIRRFRDILLKRGINATLRHSMGRGIDSACGQLRRKYID